MLYIFSACRDASDISCVKVFAIGVYVYFFRVGRSFSALDLDFLHLLGESQPNPVHPASPYDSGMAIGHFWTFYSVLWEQIYDFAQFLDKMSFFQPAGHKFLLAIYFVHWAKGTSLCLAFK